MDRKLINHTMLTFLKDKQHKVAAIKGKWGIGKTYYWKNFLKSNRSTLEFKAYSYVSLFGLTNIESVKKQIFNNFELLGSDKAFRHLDKLKPILKITKAINIPYVSSSGAITDLIESNFIENFLICFDDLERKESTLTPSAILGLISTLTEEKECKIVIIYNDNELDEHTQADIKQYRDKVIDLEIKYQPSIEENISLIWPLNHTPYVKEVFTALELNNIRIMKRVKWALEYFEKSVGENYIHLKDPFNRKTIELTILYYAYSEEVSIEELVDTASNASYTYLIPGKEDRTTPPSILNKLKYISEEYDKIIGEYLIDGYVNLDPYEEILSKHNERHMHQNINQELRNLWLRYYKNFATTEEEFVKAQVEFLRLNYEHLYITDLAKTISFIQEIDSSQKLNGILEKSIDQFVHSADDNDLRYLYRNPPPKNILKIIEDKYAQIVHEYPISNLMEELAGSNGWSPSKIKYLKHFSADDYFAWFISENELDVVNLLSVFISRFGKDDATEKAVVQEIKSALDKIKCRSKLDKMRVESMIEKQTT